MKIVTCTFYRTSNDSENFHYTYVSANFIYKSIDGIPVGNRN